LKGDADDIDRWAIVGWNGIEALHGCIGVMEGQEREQLGDGDLVLDPLVAVPAEQMQRCPAGRLAQSLVAASLTGWLLATSRPFQSPIKT
jgi:hypothetical protein